ncbi:MAG: TIGR04282 family arsenosugar biosynthesis glycosyltransferase [Hyphomicrobiaceae bacterium]|nr:TIGR04282 family arsenosugar biosynthesis glycosyltransferase [Hyphomicrobiaceae bacterium]
MRLPGRLPREAPRRGAAPFRCRLVVMAKVPQAGRVKTRLAGEIGAVRATWFYRHTAAAVLARLSACRSWQTVLAVAPDAGVAHPFWPRNIMRVPQGGGDIGERMRRAMRLKLRGPVVVIGTDIPAVRPSHIAAAFRALGGSDAVFGPAADGGYWLAGQRRRPRDLELFGHVRWSSPHALSDTLRGLRGRRIATVATLSDVDNADELRKVVAWCGRRVLPVQAGKQLARECSE